jgi:hypothetical protein
MDFEQFLHWHLASRLKELSSKDEFVGEVGFNTKEDEESVLGVDISGFVNSLSLFCKDCWGLCFS